MPPPMKLLGFIVKAQLYKYGFKPVYNLLPEPIALRFAYKYSITAVKL